MTLDPMTKAIERARQRGADKLETSQPAATTSSKRSIKRAREDQRNAELRQIREQRLAEKAADAAAEAAAEHERVFNRRREMVLELRQRIIDRSDSEGWVAEGLVVCNDYYEAIIHVTDRELPDIGQYLGDFVREQFVRVAIRYEDVLPKDMLVGQRQDWFQPLYDKLTGKSLTVDQPTTPEQQPTYTTVSPDTMTRKQRIKLAKWGTPVAEPKPTSA